MARLQDFQAVTPTDSDNLLVVQATGQGLATVGSTIGSKMDKANPTGTGYLSLNRKANTTIGAYSTTEGFSCEASGSGSHAEGDGTIANHNSQHVFGTYNLADTSSASATSKGNYAEIVGNGTDINSRSNARTLDWSGNEVLAGGLKINGNKDVLAITPDYTNIAKNASATITMTKTNGILIITRGRTAQIATISYYALAVHNGSYVNFELLTNTADNTVTLTTLGSRQLQISTTADYGISFRLLEF